MSNPDDPTYEVTREVRDGCLCLYAQRAARLLARRFDTAFRPLGLTSGQFSLMMSLNRPEPATLGAVSGLLGMDRTTLTAALKPLERRGLVAAAPGKDRRSRGLALTDAGRALLAAAVPVWRAEHAALDAMLGKGGGRDLAARLGRLTDGLAGGMRDPGRDPGERLVPVLTIQS